MITIEGDNPVSKDWMAGEWMAGKCQPVSRYIQGEMMLSALGKMFSVCGAESWQYRFHPVLE